MNITLLNKTIHIFRPAPILLFLKPFLFRPEHYLILWLRPFTHSSAHCLLIIHKFSPDTGEGDPGLTRTLCESNRVLVYNLSIFKEIESLQQTLIFWSLHLYMIFQTMNSIRSNNLCLEYQRFTPSGYGGKEIRKLEFVTITQFLYRVVFSTLH